MQAATHTPSFPPPSRHPQLSFNRALNEVVALCRRWRHLPPIAQPMQQRFAAVKWTYALTAPLREKLDEVCSRCQPFLFFLLGSPQVLLETNVTTITLFLLLFFSFSFSFFSLFFFFVFFFLFWTLPICLLVAT